MVWIFIVMQYKYTLRNKLSGAKNNLETVKLLGRFGIKANDLQETLSNNHFKSMELFQRIWHWLQKEILVF